MLNNHEMAFADAGIAEKLNKSDWKMVRVEDVIEKPLSGEWGDGEGNINVLRTTNFNNDGTINFANIVQRDISYKKIKQKALKYGDSIIEKSGGSPSQPVGRVVYFNSINDDVYLCNNFTSVIRSKDQINSKFLFWKLFNNHLTGNTLKYQNKTTGIINLQLERYLKEIQIPLPPLATQKYIADLLDKADALRKKDQQLLKYYDDLAQSLFINLFGDPVKNKKGTIFSELIEINPKKSEINLNDDELVSFIPMNKVGEKGEFDNSLIKDYSEAKSGFTYFCNSDVLFAKITPCMENGKGAIAKNLKNNIGFGSTEFHVFRPNKNLSAEYIYNLLSLPSLRKYAEINMTGSAGQKRVPISFFSKIKISVPPIHLQNQFAEQIQNIEQQKEKVKTQIQASENLFKGLLQQVFN